MSNVGEWEEHQQYGRLKLTWSQVPLYMNKILNIINPQYHYHQRAEAKENIFNENLVSLTKAQLKDGINYLKAHEEYGFTYRKQYSWGGSRIFLVADCPKLKYRKYERSRGLGATYRNNFFTLKKFHTAQLKRIH